MTPSSSRYQITQQDIDTTLLYLQTQGNKDATVEDAIDFLEQKQAEFHVTAHKIVEDEINGKVPFQNENQQK